jgi:hypothetical protein
MQRRRFVRYQLPWGVQTSHRLVVAQEFAQVPGLDAWAVPKVDGDGETTGPSAMARLGNPVAHLMMKFNAQ